MPTAPDPRGMRSYTAVGWRRALPRTDVGRVDELRLVAQPDRRVARPRQVLAPLVLPAHALIAHCALPRVADPLDQDQPPRAVRQHAVAQPLRPQPPVAREPAAPPPAAVRLVCRARAAGRGARQAWGGAGGCAWGGR